MAEKKGVGHAYNVDFLNVVFAASSLFLFLSVIWMVWDDFDREWKNTQRRFAQLEYQVTQAQREQAVRSVDRNKLAQLEAQRKQAEQNIAANRKKVDELQDQLKDADNKVFRATLDYNYMKATYDQDRYDFETTREADPKSSATARKQKNAEEEAKRLADLNLAMEKAIADKEAVQKQLVQYTGQAAAAEKQIEDMRTEQTRLGSAYFALDIGQLRQKASHDLGVTRLELAELLLQRRKLRAPPGQKRFESFDFERGVGRRLRVRVVLQAGAVHDVAERASLTGRGRKSPARAHFRPTG